ncbi:MAG: glycolate oxidase subunit GlcF, partial [Alphaproteobacteria bacterium]|nr:glycolate oxidase subunit GlcF [Alphaproteobacteria bacterium]
MRTDFQAAQLADLDVAEADAILRKCVHCGFCTATCPTYVLLGDELDSPRGRIYLIKNMLESGARPDARTVRHIDRCLSCLSCMTTCPSGVNYMHLLDRARARIEARFRRPLGERWLRRILAAVLPRPGLFRLALRAARLMKPLAGLAPGRLRGLLAMAPDEIPLASDLDQPQVHPATGARKLRVALLTGCAQRVLDPGINAATVRLLTRLGCDVVVAKGAGCCGALTHHMGREGEAMASIRANVGAWTAELDGEGLDAVVINASGCGTTVKDYGHILAEDPVWAGPAKRIAELALDITEVVQRLDLPAPPQAQTLKVAYHAACSLQHGQKITTLPKQLLQQVGFAVLDVPEGHLCCGSAGTYNLLQPEL